MPPVATSLKQPIRVMVVDDSAIVRGLITRSLSEHQNITVVATAFDGFSAIAEIQRQPIDIVLLDIEMPRMDGITALPELLKLSPHSKVIIASTLSQRNAEISLRALSLGASDYLSKPSTSRDKNESDRFYRELVEKILAFAPANPIPSPKSEQPAQKTTLTHAFKPDAIEVRKNALTDMGIYPTAAPRAVAIASSTGGPQALLKLFTELKGKLLNVPIFITQHMPPNFTTILANNIRQVSEKDCHEAIDGEVIRPGTIYLAPGDFHMVPVMRDREIVISLNQNPPVNFCRPAADPMIESLCDVYGTQLLLVVLTGMGSDGYLGASKLHKSGGTVIAQDKESCVVWGMPRAVAENQVCKGVLALDDIPRYLLKACWEK